MLKNRKTQKINNNKRKQTIVTKGFKKKIKEQTIARINSLFCFAEEQKNKPELGKRYVFLARKLSSKTKVRIPRELKRRFCKYCNTYFIAGRNYRVRTTGKTITYTCSSCGKWTRIGYKNKTKRRNIEDYSKRSKV